MMTFKLHLKKVSKQGHTRIKFDLEKLKDNEIAEAFKVMKGGKFAPLTSLDADDSNNSKKAYQLVKDMTSSKQGRTTTIHDKNGKRLTEDKDILNR